ncbi:MAG: amino acid ABC transporter substrate-binding protein [Burkholderiales bacterium]|jgi:ABC-type amino acid transport substrate-binding protein
MRAVLAIFVLTTLYITPLAAKELTGTLKQINTSGEIRIGYRKSEPPLSFIDSDGLPAGYSLDVCRHIVVAVNATLGKDVKVAYVPVDAENRFSALTDNKIDILCGSTTQTLVRRELVDFTALTFVTGASLMSLKATNLLDFPSLKGKKIGVVKDTTTDDALKAVLEKTGVEATIVEVESADDGMKQLRNKKIDAFSADQIVLIGLAISAKDTGDFAIARGVYSFEPFALAVRRNDADFRLVADRAISDLYRSGAILPIYDKWMGSFAKTRPPLFDALFQLNAIPEGH